MTTRDISLGDFVILSLDEDGVPSTATFVIRYIRDDGIYISPPNIDVFSKIVRTPTKYGVFGALDKDYQITFVAAPRPETLIGRQDPIPVTQTRNRKDFFATPAKREQYAALVNASLNQISAPDGYQCFDSTANVKLSDYIDLPKVLGKGSFGTVYMGCIRSPTGECTDDSLVFAVKTAQGHKASVKIDIAARNRSDPWVESYLLDELKPLILDQGRGQILPIIYRTYRCVDGCKFEDTAGLKSCIITLTELAEGDLNTWFDGPGKYGNADDYNNVLFQLMAGLAALQDSGVQIFHDDLKKENIFWYAVQPGGVWKYIIGGREYYLPNRGYVLVIGDYGISKAFGPDINQMTSTLGRGGRIRRRGSRGFVRDGDNYVLYPVPSNMEKDYPHFGIQGRAQGSVNSLNEIPTEVGRDLNNIGVANNFIRVTPRGYGIAPVEYRQFPAKTQPKICPEFTLPWKRQKELMAGLNLCSDDVLSRNDLYPPVEFMKDTQDIIRSFTGGKRMTQPGDHRRISMAPAQWMNKIDTYISEPRDNVSLSGFSYKMLAQDFIHSFFTDKYGPEKVAGQPVLAEFRTNL